MSDAKILYIAICVFSLYTRKVPFSHFERFLAAAMAHYIAAKVSYRKPEIETYERFVHEKAPNTTIIVANGEGTGGAAESEVPLVRQDFAQVKD